MLTWAMWSRPPRKFGQEHVTGDHGRFGGGGYTLQSQPGGNKPLMHVAAPRQGLVLGVADDHEVKGPGVF